MAELVTLPPLLGLAVGGYAETRTGGRVRLVEARTGTTRGGRRVPGFLCLLPGGDTLVMPAALLRPLS